MKRNMKITGTVELSKKDLLDAIDNYLKLKVKRIQYPKNGADLVLCEIDQVLSDDQGLRMVGEVAPIAQRAQSTGYTKRFKGFFNTAKGIFESKRKDKKKEMTFDEFLKEIRFEYPEIESTRVAQYLHDPRQLPDINWKSKEGVIVL